MGKGSCSVCSAPANVTAAVNTALSKKEKLRDIAAMAGLSKSAIHRHSKHVYRDTLSAHAARFDYRTNKLLVIWPGESIPSNLDEHTVILKVEYESLPLYNPSALKRDGQWTADAQRDFFARVPANVQRGFVNGEHEKALLENQQRDAPHETESNSTSPEVSNNGHH